MTKSNFFSVGIVNDPRFALHLTGFGHVESPKRVDVILSSLRAHSLLTQHNSIAPRLASIQELELVHSIDYIFLVEQETSRLKDQEVKMLSTGDVMISKDTYEIAKLAAGGVLNAIDAVFNERFSKVFCVVRPPGHHALRNIGMGFCIFNNVVIGAQYALSKYRCKKVLIVDWDLHHGNGTEALVKNDPRIFYFSTHQSPLWPGTGQESERGAGNIQNIEIAAGLASREKILDAYSKRLAESMESFKPDLVLISAGFDAHEQDPLGSLALKTEDFSTLTHTVKKIADRFASGKIISVLEGGYHLDGLADSALAHVRGLTSH